MVGRSAGTRSTSRPRWRKRRWRSPGERGRQASAEQSEAGRANTEIAQQRWRLERELGREWTCSERSWRTNAVPSKAASARRWPLSPDGSRPRAGNSPKHASCLQTGPSGGHTPGSCRAAGCQPGPPRALALRAVIGEAGLRQGEAAAAGERLRLDGRRWQAALLVRTEIEAHRSAARRAMRPLEADLDAAEGLTMARSPEPAAMVGAQQDHKRAIELEAKLDRSLLRALGGWPAYRPARRSHPLRCTARPCARPPQPSRWRPLPGRSSRAYACRAEVRRTGFRSSPASARP